jgi:hypothetical protein
MLTSPEKSVPCGVPDKVARLMSQIYEENDLTDMTLWGSSAAPK